MGQVQQLWRQGDLLALMEPGPVLPMTAQAAAIPLLAALLLEVAEAQTGTKAEDAAMQGGRDEQDRV
ncbi:hypothetical protein [Aquibium sp. ELW1220]|uniref:hypothetical protein n=1 Tax=Aquibium sp. ELW1220 TaxID=2976766 RepID=UPI0025B0F6FF|nr:hypothetical protein [Aquibium sp. ELW1220]MDN2584365.1 hypothetical protein [Aquibium sp. ELW1220]